MSRSPSLSEAEPHLSAAGSPRGDLRMALARHAMVAPGDRVGVAVSGGADSLALLLALHELAPELGLQLAVVHFDHALRPESAADAVFVQQLAARLGLPLLARRAQGLGGARGNREQAARQARYAFFRACLAGESLAAIATAHTADDQAETVLLRLLRGAGTRGLAGIWPVLVWREGRILRPFLACRRAALRAWLMARGEIWREDASNLDLSRRRNRIRHELLPALARDYNPGLVGRLAALATLAREDEEYWCARIAAHEPQLWRGTPAGLEAATAALAQLPPALAHRSLRAAAARAGGQPGRLDAALQTRAWELIRGVAAGRHPGAKCLEFAGLTLRIGRRRTQLGRAATRL